MEQYDVLRMIARLRILRYLISRADQRGYTHGEKHWLLQVALMEILTMLSEFKSPELNWMQNQDVTPPDINDIPF